MFPLHPGWYPIVTAKGVGDFVFFKSERIME
jgi:hypothetical protein